MARRDAVKIATAARNNARLSIDRMKGYVERGNLAGAKREAQFLNALDRNARIQASRVTGNRVRIPASTTGTRALSAVTAGDRMALSIVLADLSYDIMEPARTPVGGYWVWTAHTSACIACLDEHGTIYSSDYTFYPMHHSCHCFPDTIGLARELTDSEIGGLLIQRGGRDARLGELLMAGSLSLSSLVVSIPGGGRGPRRKNLPPVPVEDSENQE